MKPSEQIFIRAKQLFGESNHNLDANDLSRDCEIQAIVEYLDEKERLEEEKR